MKAIRTRLCLFTVLAAAGTIAATGALAGGASAKPPSSKGAGPSSHGKETVEIECEGLGSLTVSVPRNEHNNAAAQIVGEKGHGIPVSFKTTVTDVSKGRVLFTETHESGHGHGHPNQATTLCKGSAFEGSAEEIFGKELPSEVAPADLIRGVFDVNVIVKK